MKRSLDGCLPLGKKYLGLRPSPLFLPYSQAKPSASSSRMVLLPRRRSQCTLALALGPTRRPRLRVATRASESVRVPVRPVCPPRYVPLEVAAPYIPPPKRNLGQGVGFCYHAAYPSLHADTTCFAPDSALIAPHFTYIIFDEGLYTPRFPSLQFPCPS